MDFDLLFFDPPRFLKYQVPEPQESGKVAPERSGQAEVNSYEFPGAQEGEVMQPLSIFFIFMMICQFSGCAKTTSTASVAPITDGGASPSQKTAAPITNVGVLPAQKTQSELKVGAEPYYANRQKSTFGQDMSQKGILPVMVFLENNGAQPLKVTPTLISLEFQEGGEVNANSTPAGLLPAPAPAPPPPPPDTTGAKVVRVVAVTAIIALAISPAGWLLLPFSKSPVETQKEKLQTKLQETELREVTLAKGESAQGFVFFFIPQGVQQSVGAHLVVPYLPAQGRSGKVRVPLGGM
jgi:hypothetical protein